MEGGGGGGAPGMVMKSKRTLRFRKDSMLSVGGENRDRLVIAIACLALISLVQYCRYTHHTPGGGDGGELLSFTTTTSSPRTRKTLGTRLLRTSSTSSSGCKDRYVYIHRVPHEWNSDILADCKALREWTDMCVALSNAGLGPSMANAPSPAWYKTHQFALEVIFHNRMAQYECLTSDPHQATAIYVPLYAGLEAQRTLWEPNLAFRDAIPLQFQSWLKAQPEWAPHGGLDHFMVGGRITWDFRRMEHSSWGNILLHLPAIQNMTTLVIESSPWDTIDQGIPYPTNFHPSSDSELREWQERVRSADRPVLFSFAGGTRRDMSRLIRGQLIDQCRRSPFCKLLSCDGGACESPLPLMKLFEESQFCLQPQGDSPTRKSIFDSMLAGCIPVFFHPHSYSGYAWHLPKNQSEYSVFINEEHIRSGIVSVESVLRKIPKQRIQEMRERIVELIPNLVYSDPRSPSPLEESTDAFGIAIKGVLERIAEKKRVLKQQQKQQLVLQQQQL